MTNEEIANKYLLWVSENYTYLKNKYFNLCKEKQWNFDEDIFSETYLKVYEIIKKKGIKDPSDRGMECYTFRSFQNNIRNEQRYCRNKKRDLNISSDNINDLYEEYYNKTKTPAIEKIMSDLRKDFFIIWLMSLVEKNFDSESFYLFRIKTLSNMTFKQLAEQTKIKASRRKVIDVMHWIRENITQEDAEAAFKRFYENYVEE